MGKIDDVQTEASSVYGGNYRAKGGLEEYCHSMGAASSTSSSSLTTVTSKAVQEQPSFDTHAAPNIPAVQVIEAVASFEASTDDMPVNASLEYDSAGTMQKPVEGQENFYNMFQ